MYSTGANHVEGNVGVAHPISNILQIWHNWCLHYDVYSNQNFCKSFKKTGLQMIVLLNSYLFVTQHLLYQCLLPLVF